MILVTAVLLKGDSPTPAKYGWGCCWKYCYLFNIKSEKKLKK